MLMIDDCAFCLMFSRRVGLLVLVLEMVREGYVPMVRRYDSIPVILIMRWTKSCMSNVSFLDNPIPVFQPTAVINDEVRESRCHFNLLS